MLASAGKVQTVVVPAVQSVVAVAAAGAAGAVPEEPVGLAGVVVHPPC